MEIIFLIIYPLKILYKGEEHFVDVEKFSNIEYYDLSAICGALGYKFFYDQQHEKFIINFKEKKAILGNGNPFFLIGDKVYNYYYPPKKYLNSFYAPLPLINIITKKFERIFLENEGKIRVYTAGIKIKKIVIDPGHGGKDPGAIGPNGTKEKDIVLDIAKRLKKLIEDSLKIECILTREEDVFMPLSERTKFANQEKADIFISIHCNACESRVRHGTEVYFLSPAKTDWERAVAARENAAIRFEEGERDTGSMIESILWDVAQTEFLKESNHLAGLILEELCKNLHSKNRGVRQANFYVLRGAYMPAVLVEAEFISNPKCEKKLKKAKYRQKIAYGIFKGICKFKEIYEKRIRL